MPEAHDTPLDWLQLAILAVLSGSLLFLWKRLETAARKITDSALASEHAVHQRRVHEYSLYTQRRHVVSARLNQRVRIASNGIARLASVITTSPCFRRCSDTQVNRYVKLRTADEFDVAVNARVALQNGNRDEFGRR